MNNLHRHLAPISDAAWEQIEQEASRTLKRHLAARRVVDVVGPKGVDLAAVGTGHLHQIQPPGDGILASQREAQPLIEMRWGHKVTALPVNGDEAVLEVDTPELDNEKYLLYVPVPPP